MKAEEVKAEIEKRIIEIGGVKFHIDYEGQTAVGLRSWPDGKTKLRAENVTGKMTYYF